MNIGKHHDHQHFEQVQEKYGDLLFDICFSVLLDEHEAENTYRQILKDLRKRHSSNSYLRYQRAWVIKMAYHRLVSSVRTSGNAILSEIGHTTGTTGTDIDQRLELFSLYYQRLPVTDRFILILHDRHNISIEEISSALNLPGTSLEFQRQQALKTLEERIWAEEFQPEAIERHQTVLNCIPKLQVMKQPSATSQAASPPQSTKLLRPSCSRWRRTPWYIRSSLESAGIAFVILLVVGMIPRLRNLYERSLERRLEAFDLAELSHRREDAKPPETAAHTEESEGELFDDELVTEEESNEPEPARGDAEDDIRVGNFEIWRFIVKTESPKDFRNKVSAILKEMKLTTNTEELVGLEAPGGIQFDLLVPRSAVLTIKERLESAANTGRQTAPTIREAFTWYKSKARKRIPVGQTRVVIWLSQI